jgi:hypothetical protein
MLSGSGAFFSAACRASSGTGTTIHNSTKSAISKRKLPPSSFAYHCIRPPFVGRGGFAERWPGPIGLAYGEP